MSYGQIIFKDPSHPQIKSLVQLFEFFVHVAVNGALAHAHRPRRLPYRRLVFRDITRRRQNSIFHASPLISAFADKTFYSLKGKIMHERKYAHMNGRAFFIF